MQDYEMDAWLDTTETTEVQRDELRRAFEEIERIYGSEDEGYIAPEITNGAAAIILADDTLESIAEAWQAARRREVEAMDTLRGAILASSIQGLREADLVRTTGLARMTVRAAMGL